MTDDIAEQGRRLMEAHRKRDAMLAAAQAYVEALSTNPAAADPRVIVAELTSILGVPA